MAIPQSNATLTAVDKGGVTAKDDAWKDSEAPPEASVWSGTAPAYYMEKRERVAGGGVENLLVRRSIIVGNDNPAIDFEDGQTLTFTWDGDTRTGTVQKVEKRKYTPAASLACTRVTLDDA